MRLSEFKAMVKLAACLSVAFGCGVSLMADTHTVESGEETLSNVTETSRTVKNGAGTLVLTGNNALGNGLQVEGGTLKFNGGTSSLVGKDPIGGVILM